MLRPVAFGGALPFQIDVIVWLSEAKKMKVGELIDNRFVKELEDSGLVKIL